MPFYSNPKMVNGFDHDGCHIEIFRREKGGFCCRLYQPIERTKCSKCGRTVTPLIIFQVSINGIQQGKLDFGDQTQAKRVAMALIAMQTFAEYDEEPTEEGGENFVVIDLNELKDEDDDSDNPFECMTPPSGTADGIRIPTAEQLEKWGWISKALAIANSSK